MSWWLAVTPSPRQTGLCHAIKLEGLCCCSSPRGPCPTGTGRPGWVGTTPAPLPVPSFLTRSLCVTRGDRAAEAFVIYCGAPSPAICQRILIPTLGEVRPASSFPPFGFGFVEGDGALLEGVRPRRGESSPWLSRERGEGSRQRLELCRDAPASELTPGSSTAFPFSPRAKANLPAGIRHHIPLTGLRGDEGTGASLL